MLRQHVPPRLALRRAALEPVDVAVVLAADCSGSISSQNLALQLDGYAGAIASAAFLQAIAGGREGRVALSFVMWSSHDRQDLAVPWTVIDGAPAAGRFVAALRAAPPPTPGWTSISGAIGFAAGLLGASGLAARRRVIDVSGDGMNNDGPPAAAARDAAVRQGIVINGLPILGEDRGIAAYYASHVIGGARAFLIVARNRASFREAVLEKLIAEIA